MPLIELSPYKGFTTAPGELVAAPVLIIDGLAAALRVKNPRMLCAAPVNDLVVIKRNIKQSGPNTQG